LSSEKGRKGRSIERKNGKKELWKIKSGRSWDLRKPRK